MLELTLNDEDEEESDNPELVPVILKTYNFKKPQFLKKLTNTYFKKSKTSEKNRIFQKELVT